jgi:hypothetical protein
MLYLPSLPPSLPPSLDEEDDHLFAGAADPFCLLDDVLEEGRDIDLK